MDSIQYNTALAITGAIRGTCREKLYQELGLDSLRKRGWYRKLCYFLQIFKGQSPQYLFRILPSVAGRIIQELIIIFPSSMGNIIFSEIFFADQLSLNGITYT